MDAVLTKICRIALLAGLSLALASGAHAANYVRAGNVSVSWKLDEILGASPKDARLTNLMFRFNVGKETLHHRGTYFAQQFHFDNSGSSGTTGYLGLQPQSSEGGKAYLRAVFSTFISGAKTNDDHCYAGADGGDGASCGVEFPAIYGRTYGIRVFKTGNHTWSGEVQDMVTNESIHIGSWTLPDTTGDLRPSGEGFAEYYAFYMAGYPQFVVPTCVQLAKIDVVYGPVTTDDFGGGIGSVYDAREYGSEECRGKDSGFFSQSKKVSVIIPVGRTLSANSELVQRGFVTDSHMVPY